MEGRNSVESGVQSSDENKMQVRAASSKEAKHMRERSRKERRLFSIKSELLSPL